LDASPTVEAYVTKAESGGGAAVLRDSTATVTSRDPFGYVVAEDVATVGVDLTLHVERTFKNDTSQWILGQLQTQKECSAAAMLTQCRTLTRHTTTFGEVHDDTIGDDAGTPDTQLTVTYDRDPFGNVKGVTADDAFGHHRASSTVFDSEGIYPTQVNAAGQVSLTTYDPACSRSSTPTSSRPGVRTTASGASAWRRVPTGCRRRSRSPAPRTVGRSRTPGA
jgi:hypothetical protein